MKIISQFKDFYDCCASTGIDNTIIYKRELQAFEKDQYVNILFDQFELKSRFGFRHPTHLSTDKGYISTGLNLFFIGFCGKFYPIFKFRKTSGDTNIYFNLDNIMALGSFVDDDSIKHWFTTYRYDRQSSFISLIQTAKKVVDKEWIDPFIHFKSPILVFCPKVDRDSNDIVFVNSQLNKYEFQKIKDPYTAFQEISMFFDNTIPRQPPETITISDKDRIAGHGFDKWSFRTKVR